MSSGLCITPSAGHRPGAFAATEAPPSCRPQRLSRLRVPPSALLLSLGRCSVLELTSEPKTGGKAAGKPRCPRAVYTAGFPQVSVLVLQTAEHIPRVCGVAIFQPQASLLLPPMRVECSCYTYKLKCKTANYKPKQTLLIQRP